MEKTSKLIFIGEVISSNEIRITRKPSIQDAFLLSNKSLTTLPQLLSNPYQSIPLEEPINILIHINTNHFILSYQHHSLKIAENDKMITEEEFIDVFTNFIVRIGDKVTYFGTSPHCKMRPRKKKLEG